MDGSLSANVIVVALSPVVVGVKRAVIVQVCLKASVRPEHASATIAKSAGSAPPSQVAVIASSCAPTFITVNIHGGEGRR